MVFLHEVIIHWLSKFVVARAWEHLGLGSLPPSQSGLLGLHQRFRLWLEGFLCARLVLTQSVWDLVVRHIAMV